jgi:hypothetical protein
LQKDTAAELKNSSKYFPISKKIIQPAERCARATFSHRKIFPGNRTTHSHSASLALPWGFLRIKIYGDMAENRKDDEKIRIWITRGFTTAEDVVYIGLGVLLATAAIFLLIIGSVAFVQSLISGTLQQEIVSLLDRILLILLIVEIIYTVQVSFREHTLVPAPFLLIGLIAVTRRILVLTAELPQ